ncbi:MAG: hypothetical protein GHCLOJNM_04075 [bacterium]|nr:hypothetical protein [bacterium]
MERVPTGVLRHNSVTQIHLNNLIDRWTDFEERNVFHKR